LKKDALPNLHLHTNDAIAECSNSQATELEHEHDTFTSQETLTEVPNVSKQECLVSRTFCEVATQTIITCFDNNQFNFIDSSLTAVSSKLLAYSQAVDDGNSARFCYEHIQRSLQMDHTYSTIFQTPPQPFRPLTALANTYSSSDSSTTSEMEDDKGRGADTREDYFMDMECTSQELDSSTSTEITTAANPVDDNKLIVFESCLKKLLTRCRECGLPIRETQFMYDASNVSVIMTCVNSHATRWDSQPKLSHYHTGNALLSRSSFLTGILAYS